jgi:DNA-binding NtrC family response regulator
MQEDHPCVFVVDDDQSTRESLSNLLRSTGLNVQTFASAHEFLTHRRPDAPSCLVLDVQLPGCSGLELQQALARGHVPIPIIFITGHGDIPMTVRAMKAGAIDFLTKPFRDDDLLSAVAQAMPHGRQRAPGTHTPDAETLAAEDDRRSDSRFSEIVGHSAALHSVLQEVALVAPTDAAVLIYGETGTGKELIARALHRLSARRTHPFVTLNCAAIPPGLLESELFGHEKGAFTGALTQRLGRFELANGGTLFLDEIGDLPLELQPKLLRVLQEHTFERLGSSRTLRTNVRLVAATHRDLLAMVQHRTFREDLYYRLQIFPLTVPPLRERRDDIPVLVRHFAQQYAHQMHKPIARIPAEAMAALAHYDWPGNVRELQNVIERVVILSSHGILWPQVPVRSPEAHSAALAAPRSATLDDAMRAHILNALHATHWVVAGPHGAAARLGMKRSTLASRMAKLGIVRELREHRLGPPPWGRRTGMDGAVSRSMGDGAPTNLPSVTL